MEIIVRELKETGEHFDQTYQFHEIEGLAKPFDPTKRTRDILFLTGNKNKVVELEQNLKLKHVKIETLDIDLAEIQDSNVLTIVQDKCERAFQRINKFYGHKRDEGPPPNYDDHQSSNATGESVGGSGKGEGQENNVGGGDTGGYQQRTILVEDTCLAFKSFNGLPGPYIKWFLKALGCEGLHKMLAGFEDKSAEAICTYALMENRNRIVFFRGVVRGRVVAPRGSSWGWDPIFEEERSSLTFGEMDSTMKSSFSHRANAITLLKKYLST